MSCCSSLLVEILEKFWAIANLHKARVCRDKSLSKEGNEKKKGNWDIPIPLGVCGGVKSKWWG